ncbi:cupin domain-containing protein [Pengzhenrongella sp.]|jgi:mannose-6-phosphate isomerase-like protein (cupin superfamily)|uniref:cupin domain-containing protein n=1 Tax=Pengzhenrongella sp. TaxID=2888820 RepID=UPI002F93BF6A
MAGTAISTPGAEPSHVLGVHEGDCVPDGDGFEWVALVPGAETGTHQHGHTEEAFYFLSGSGVVTLDGEGFEVQPGDVVLTPVMSDHAVANTGDSDLAYLVIEVLPPPISGALPPWRPR